MFVGLRYICVRVHKTQEKPNTSPSPIIPLLKEPLSLRSLRLRGPAARGQERQQRDAAHGRAKGSELRPRRPTWGVDVGGGGGRGGDGELQISDDWLAVKEYDFNYHNGDIYSKFSKW